MNHKATEISKAISLLQSHIDEIVSVEEFAEKMGYEHSDKFNVEFRSYFGVYPKKVIVAVRLASIICELRQNDSTSMAISQKYKLRTDKSLNKFLNYHLGCSPNRIKEMPKPALIGRIQKTFRQKLGERFWDQYSGVILGN